MPRPVLPVLLVTGLATFMASLDNLVVTTALPGIRAELGADLEGLEWTVNAYTLTFAVLMLTAAALGDRFGRRAVFVGGIAVFTAGSAAAALAVTPGLLVAARALQGVGAAAIVPLSLTILATSVPPERRGVAIAGLGGMGGLAIAVGPLVGGLVVEAADWHGIFWLNVPVGILLVPPALRLLDESRGPAGTGGLDLPGTALVTAAMLAVIYGVARSTTVGWADPMVLAGVVAGPLLLWAFLLRERRARSPLLPPALLRNPGFVLSSGVALLVQAAMIGAVFLLTQYLQIVLGYSPLTAGLRTLPWTLVPLVVAPLAGLLAERVGVRVLVVASAALQAVALAWFALVVGSLEYAALVGPMVLAGVAMGLFFALTGRQTLDLVPAAEQGVASGVSNAMRQLGAVLGVVTLGGVFSAAGGYAGPADFVAGLSAALLTGAGVTLLGVVCALRVPQSPVGTRPVSAVRSGPRRAPGPAARR